MAKSKYTKRSDGRYQRNIKVGYDEEKKKDIYKTVYAYDADELDDKAAEVIDAVNKGVYADDKKMTVKDLAEKWFKTEKAVCGIRTKEMYERITYKHIIPAIGEIRLRELKKSDVQIMINDRADKYRTCQQLRMATKQMLDFAVGDGLIFKNVATSIKLPEKDDNEKRALTDTEKKAIQKADLSEKEKAFIYTLLYTGLRRGEILALSKGDIRIDDKLIYVRNAVTFDKNRPIIKPTLKTKAGEREIPISKELEGVLKPYIDSLKTYYIFPSERGELMAKSTYTDFWGRIIGKLNLAAGGNESLQVINGLTTHVFRHNYATMLYYAKIPMKDAQELLGHKNIQLTMDIYTHLDKSNKSVKRKLETLSAL